MEIYNCEHNCRTCEEVNRPNAGDGQIVNIILFFIWWFDSLNIIELLPNKKKLDMYHDINFQRHLPFIWYLKLVFTGNN